MGAPERRTLPRPQLLRQRADRLQLRVLPPGAIVPVPVASPPSPSTSSYLLALLRGRRVFALAGLVERSLITEEEVQDMSTAVAGFHVGYFGDVELFRI